MEMTKQLLLFIILISFFACKNDSKPQKENVSIVEKEDYQDNTDSDTSCLANADWFTLIDGTRKTPAPKEGSTSVFANNATVTNCDFHQWSWQKFLWLTNTDINGKPIFINNLIQVSSDGKSIEQGKGIILTDTAQASSTKDILKTNQDFSADNDSSHTVYYSIHMDSILHKTMVKYAPIAKKDPSKVKDVTFPVGSLEVKISWVNAKALKDTTSYYITNGEIEGKKSRIALLGMHVVGVVENHPEFVWATFEHENLAPKYDWTKATPTSDANVTSTSNYLLFNKDSTSTVKNITTQNGIYTDVFSVYTYGVPVKKTIEGNHDVQVFMETSQNGSENFNNIRSINESVKNQLKDVWNNYFYNGSIWINTEGYDTTKAQASLLDSLSYNLPDSEVGKLTRGSVSAYNITMETYVQVGFAPTSIHEQTVKNLVNCFSCHNASGNKSNLSPLYISHLFNGYLKSLQGLSKEEIKEEHVNEIKEHALLRKNQK